MIIGFDLQALQTDNSRNRGIGRYSHNLLNKIIEFDKDNNFKLFLNGSYKDPVNLNLTTNAEVITVNYELSSSNHDNIVNGIAQLLKYRSYKMDIFHVLSPFEGYPSNLPVITPYFERLGFAICSTVYDLIPLHFPSIYFSNPEFKKAYYKQMRTLFSSDILFAISESTRRDVINLLGFDPTKVINIEGAATEEFHHIENLSPKEIEHIKKKYKINKRFVLYPTGIDFRKNIEVSIKAFSKISVSLLNDTSYVIVCAISKSDKNRLLDIAKSLGIGNNLILTGFISDENLNLLYNCCDVLLFPSLMEGFGLPILEAMKCGAPIIGSNVNGVAHLIEDEDFMFDPQNVEEMTRLMTKMLTDVEFRARSINHSLEKSKNYSWENVAKKVLSAYRYIHEKKLPNSNNHSIRKLSIAYFSPVPPNKSGIANYSAVLLPFLSKYWDIDIFIDTYSCDEPYLVSNFDIYPYTDFEWLHRSKKYDIIVYHVGNSDNHTYMFDTLQKYPGIVVLHDVYLSGVIYWNTARLGRLNEFVDEVIYSHGDYGNELVERAKRKEIGWDHLIWNLQINKRILDNSLSVIVHSQWDRDNIVKLYPQFKEKVSVIPHFSQMNITKNKASDKRRLGFAETDFLICTFGFVVTTKKIDSILENITNFLKSKKNCKLVIVGDMKDQYAETIRQVVKDHNLSDKVVFTGFVDETEYRKYLSICDVCIQFRKDFRGGGSGTINQALGAGLPVILTDAGPFSEFPDNVVIKIKPDQEKKLANIVEDLYQNESTRVELGKKARTFAEKNSVQSIASKYASVIANVIENTKVGYV